MLKIQNYIYIYKILIFLLINEMEKPKYLISQILLFDI